MTSAPASQARILVIHPTAAVRKQIVKELAPHYEVAAVGAARSALAALEQNSPNIIFCAAEVLSRNDWKLLRQLQSAPSRASAALIILSSPEGEGRAEELVREGLAAGADDFLRAPYGGPELHARIRPQRRSQELRDQLEADFREREGRLRSSLMASRFGAYRWDFATGEGKWDASLNELMGYPPRETLVTHERFREWIHPLDRDEVDHRCALCMSEGSGFEMEYRLRKADGTYVWLHDRAETVRDASGTPLYMAGACMDVSDRKHDELRRQFVLRLDEALRPLTDAAEITATAAEHLGKHLDADRCVYGDVMPDEDSFEIRGNYCRGVVSVSGTRTFSQFGEALLQKMRANEPQIVEDVYAYYPDAENRESYDRIETRASICVPLNKNGRLVGVMAVHQKTPREWLQDEVDLAHFVVARCWESMERARITRSLQESERRHRQLANFVPMMVWEAQPDGAVDYFNDRWYEFTGFDRSVKGDLSWSPILHPDDAKKVHDVWYQAVRNREPYQVECRLKDRRTGGYRWFMGRAIPVLDDAGEVVRWFGTTADIHDAKLTEQALRQSEERLKAIIEATPECVKIVARDGRVLQINRSGVEVLGAASEDALCGRSILEVVAPEYRQSYMENHEKVCMGESCRWEFEITRRDGARRWMETHAVPVTTTDGDPAQLAITRDITHRRLRDDEREQLLAAERAARTEAEHAGRVKDEFLATLSHELRTPMNAILGYATLVGMSQMDERELAEAIDTIERNARLQAKLIEDLLDMHRIISGKVTLAMEPFHLHDVVEAAVEAARPVADAKRVVLQTIIDPLSGPLRADPTRVQQVAGNLIANAIKFTPEGGEVQICVERVDSQIELVVADTGEGIEADFLPHVFDRFRQADATTTRKHGGLGLGLSIVKHLVELHGGSVAATSAGKGQGARFRASFPAMDPTDVKLAGQLGDWPLQVVAGHTQSFDLGGIHVLTVDDEPDAGKLVKRVLERRGAIVQIAHSARQAMSLIHQQHFDVLISDVGMPAEDGYELIHAIRTLEGARRHIPAIALTAFVRPEDRQRAALAGFDTHLRKPIEVGELLSVVASLTGRFAL